MQSLQEATHAATVQQAQETDIEDVAQVEDEEEGVPYVLSENQQNHVQRMVEISRISTIIRDTSETGTGKTYTSFSLAKELGLGLIFVCPASLQQPTHEKWLRHPNVPELVAIYSYDSLGKARSEGIYSVGRSFVMHSKLERYIKKGVLIVCDEYHYVKNAKTRRSKVMKFFINTIVNRVGPTLGDDNEEQTRVLVCSATQMDKEEHILGFLENMGYIDGPLIAGKNVRNYIAVLRVALALAREYNKLDVLRDIEKAMGVKLYSSTFGPLEPRAAVEAKRANAIAYQITSLVIFPLITSEMEPFIPRPTFNAFFDFSRKRDDKMFKKGLDYLINYRGSGATFSYMNEGVKYTQKAARYEAVDFLCAFLETYPTSKVCLAASYIDEVLLPAERQFRSAGYTDILVLTDRTANTASRKQETIRKFQEDDEYRVLLMTSTLGVGIDLHDINPDGRPRISVVLRDFSPIITHQMAGRFFRRGMYTFGPCYIFNSLKYGTAYNHITRLVKEKSGVLQSVIKNIFDEDMTRTFPGNYPRCIVDGIITGKSGKEHAILYINERDLAKRTADGKPLSDAALIHRYINRKKLPFVDKPLWFLEEPRLDTDDDFPAQKRPVDETFKGLKGIYWLNDEITSEFTDDYIPTAGTSDDNRYDKEDIEKISKETVKTISGRAREIFTTFMAETKKGDYELNEEDYEAGSIEEDDFEQEIIEDDILPEEESLPEEID